MKDDDDIVYRRIRPDWVKSFDPLALKSIAFQNLEGDNMSGHLGSILKAVSYTHLTLPTNREV